MSDDIGQEVLGVVVGLIGEEETVRSVEMSGACLMGFLIGIGLALGSPSLAKRVSDEVYSLPLPERKLGDEVIVRITREFEEILAQETPA